MSRKKELELVKQYAEAPGAYEFLKQELEDLGWDTSELVEMLREHLLIILQGFIEAKLNGKKLKKPAKTVKNKKNKNKHEMVTEIIYELVRPYLNDELTVERAFEVCEALRKES